MPDLQSNLPWFLVLFALLVAASVARRIPVLRWMLSLGLWAVMAWLLVPLVRQSARFNPTLDHVASLLRLDDQQVSGGEVRIRMAADGHYWARVRIGDTERRLLIDSGATVTALSEDTAEAAGLDVHAPLAPVVLQTANGSVAARVTTVPSLRFGPIVARNLSAVVSPTLGNMDVLGMNFLSRLKSWRVENGTLILVPHRPQPLASDPA